MAPRTPKRGIETRKPMTSPRAVKTSRRMFNTPQTHRMRSVQLSTTTEPTKVVVDSSLSVLHQVRENNIKKHKQKVIRRGHIFDDDDEEEDEDNEEAIDVNIAPVLVKLSCYPYL